MDNSDLTFPQLKLDYKLKTWWINVYYSTYVLMSRFMGYNVQRPIGRFKFDIVSPANYAAFEGMTGFVGFCSKLYWLFSR